MTFDWKYFRLSMVVIFAAEICSLLAYRAAPFLQSVFFALALILFAILCVKNLPNALLVVYGELFVSSFGHLFEPTIASTLIPIRLGLFVVFMLVFAIRACITRSFPFRSSSHFWPLLVLIAVFIMATIWGVLRGNGIGNVLGDGNSFVFFAYLPATLAFFNTPIMRYRVAAVFAGAMTWLVTQTAVVLFLFAHRLGRAMQVSYFWIHDARLGEITRIVGDFYRIFFQSYNFALIAVFVFGALLLGTAGKKVFFRNKLWWLLVSSSALVLESFSRSFWFGAAIAGLVFVVACVLLRGMALRRG